MHELNHFVHKHTQEPTHLSLCLNFLSLLLLFLRITGFRLSLDNTKSYTMQLALCA